MAIAGFVLSFFCAVLGLIISLKARTEIRNSNGALTGDGLARAGVIISVITLAAGGIYFLAIAGATRVAMTGL